MQGVDCFHVYEFLFNGPTVYGLKADHKKTSKNVRFMPLVGEGPPWELADPKQTSQDVYSPSLERIVYRLELNRSTQHLENS